ncbi:MAG: flagellar hook-basal body complex protein [Gemmataceae bacterium]|nr:flagellar hook-basal body complex protein [Gemmataceae bacterium]
MPFNALSVSQTGISAADSSLDVTANNVANSSTVGFKTARATFRDLFYQTLAAGRAGTDPSQVGLGVGPASVFGVFTQGPTEVTGAPLDVAIEGEGFLTVALPDGTTGYTRRGNLTLDAAGNLVTADGFVLSPAVVVPPGSTDVAIGADGTVTALTPAGEAAVGRVGLTRFVNPAGLLRVGDTTFAQAPGAGEATAGFPGDPGFGALRPGALEGSNVDLTTELVNLIVAQRVFTSNIQALTVENEVIQATLDVTGRVV